MAFRKISFATALLAAASTTITTALAMPTPQSSSDGGDGSDPAPKSEEFSIALSAEGYPALSLNILHVAAGESQAAFERPSAYPGTPAYYNATGTFLDFDVGTEYPYSMTFADVGDNYGTKVPVYATAGAASGRPGFTVDYNASPQITARLDSAEEHFFACNTTINTKPILGLFWGVFQENGQPPADCVLADLVMNFNVPDGASPPSSS